MKEVAPFLRWAGGKRQLVPELLSSLPQDVRERRYVEPFLGAGSLFFALAPKKATLSDANRVLIATYKAIRETPDEVQAHLEALISSHGKTHYYKVRARYNTEEPSAEQAARFIYLNKACFNGIFRVNTKGEFNVPKGSKQKLKTPAESEYAEISKALKKIVLLDKDYSNVLEKAASDWFVYLDPPYPALNHTAYFAHYTADRFDAAAQETLAEWVHRIDNRNARFLMSNADVPAIRKLYLGFKMKTIPVRRYISCNGERLHTAELLIKNY